MMTDITVVRIEALYGTGYLEFTTLVVHNTQGRGVELKINRGCKYSPTALSGAATDSAIFRYSIVERARTRAICYST